SIASTCRCSSGSGTLVSEAGIFIRVVMVEFLSALSHFAVIVEMKGSVLELRRFSWLHRYRECTTTIVPSAPVPLCLSNDGDRRTRKQPHWLKNAAKAGVKAEAFSLSRVLSPHVQCAFGQPKRIAAAWHGRCT